MWNKVFPFYKVFWKFLFFSLFSMFYHLSALKCPHILYYFQLFIDKKWRQNISWASVSGTCYSTFSEIHRQEMKLQHLIGKILKYFQIFFFCAWICQEITWMQTWAWQKTTTRIFFSAKGRINRFLSIENWRNAQTIYMAFHLSPRSYSEHNISIHATLITILKDFEHWISKILRHIFQK